jgi:hypothetical protein
MVGTSNLAGSAGFAAPPAAPPVEPEPDPAPEPEPDPPEPELPELPEPESSQPQPWALAVIATNPTLIMNKILFILIFFTFVFN